jgi:hypothetical protein
MSAMNDSQVEGGGGAASIMGGGVVPGSYGSGRPDTSFINEQPGESTRYPSPKTPKPADRYPDALPPGRLPRKPVDRYPEATPAKPVVPNKPKKPKKRNFGPSGGSRATEID